MWKNSYVSSLERVWQLPQVLRLEDGNPQPGSLLVGGPLETQRVYGGYKVSMGSFFRDYSGAVLGNPAPSKSRSDTVWCFDFKSPGLRFRCSGVENRAWNLGLRVQVATAWGLGFCSWGLVGKVCVLGLEDS